MAAAEQGHPATPSLTKLKQGSGHELSRAWLELVSRACSTDRHSMATRETQLEGPPLASMGPLPENVVCA